MTSEPPLYHLHSTFPEWGSLEKGPLAVGRSGKSIFMVATALFFAAVFLLLLSANMATGLSHDENMYVAGGKLLAGGLLPYRDYHYFQMPYLALVYAALFALTDSLLLGARLFNTVCATLSLGVVYYVPSDLSRGAGYLTRFLVGAVGAVLIVANPVFSFTSGLAWNHSLPVLLTLLAFIMVWRGAGRRNPGWWVFGAGVLAGCAVGTRLSFAAALVPFAVGVLLLPGVATWRGRLLFLGAFVLGVLVALVPAIALFALAPDNFLFDNLRYHVVNEVYWQGLGYTRAMDLPGKLKYSWEVALEPASFLLFAFFLVLLPAAVWAVRAKWSERFGFVLAVALVPFLLAGALAPTPTWYQYFYAVVPFMVLAMVFEVAALYSLGGWWRWSPVAYGLVALACAIFAVRDYAKLNMSLSSADWVPVKVHEVGQEVGRASGEGRVLTLAPVFPLEGGLGIYDELAAGPFGWRMSGLLAADEREKLGLAAASDLDELLGSKAPRAILVGVEPGLDEPLVGYARAHGYARIRLSNGADLWIAPP